MPLLPHWAFVACSRMNFFILLNKEFREIWYYLVKFRIFYTVNFVNENLNLISIIEASGIR
jgi:hypothetical protein